MTKSGLRGRQLARWPGTSDRIEAQAQPKQPTVAEVSEHLEHAGIRRFIRLTVPRASRPSGQRIKLLPRSGPMSVGDRVLDWDPHRLAVSADWAVEDLRAWVDAAG